MGNLRSQSDRSVCLSRHDPCQLFYSLTGESLGTDTLAHSWPRGLLKYVFPPVSLLPQTLPPSTPKVYVTTIATHHDAVDGKSLGKHNLVIRFLEGARRLNPHPLTSWGLTLVLRAL